MMAVTIQTRPLTQPGLTNSPILERSLVKSTSTYRRLAFRKGAASAKVAVARKLAIRLYSRLF